MALFAHSVRRVVFAYHWRAVNPNRNAHMKIRKQQGLSIIGFLLVLGLVVFFVFMGMRIVPIYLEYYAVVSAMDGIAAEQGSSKLSLYQVRLRMYNRLYVSFADANIKDNNMQLVRRNGLQFRVAYEVRKPLIGNLDVVATFDRTVPLPN